MTTTTTSLDTVTKQDILQLLPKPSDAVQAMIDGLYAWDEQKNCEIDMITFGCKKASICYGCAATATVFKLFELTPTKAIRAYNYSSNSICEFEERINELRCGRILLLFEYYDLSTKQIKTVLENLELCLPRLNTSNWKENLDSYKKLVVLLQELGL